MKARVVLLNGVGSARKSSIAKALQTITAAPFLHVQMDIFIAMLPDALQDHADGFSVKPSNGTASLRCDIARHLRSPGGPSIDAERM